MHSDMRRRTYGRLASRRLRLSVLTVVLMSGLPVLATESGASPTTTTWQRTSFPETPAIGVVSCGTPETCIGVGTGSGVPSEVTSSTAVGTTNGGTTWTSLVFPSGYVATAIDCVSATMCVSVGTGPVASGEVNEGQIVATTDGGSTWSDDALPTLSSPYVKFDAISCASTSDCIVVGQTDAGYTILSTVDGGTAWSSQSLPAAGDGAQLEGVACPTSSDCYIAGSGGAAGGLVFATVNGGSTWASQTVPTTIGSLQAISCEFALDCVAVGLTSTDAAAIVSTVDGGTTWLSQSVPAKVDLIQEVDCNPTFCVAVGSGSFTGTADVLITSVDGGTTWTAYGVGSDAGGGGLNDVTCASSSDCLVSNGDIYQTNDVGSTWTAQTLPTGPVGTPSIACPSVMECFTTDAFLGTVNDQIGVTTNGGSSWSLQAIPAVEQLNEIACPSTTQCVVVGDAANGSGVVLTTDDAGADWVSEPNPETSGDGIGLERVSCPSTSVCFAMGNGALITTDNGGSTWTSVNYPPVTAPLDAITCPTVLDCYMVGGSAPTGEIDATTNGGATWTVQTVPEAVESLDAISCTTPTVCLAAGEEDVQDAVILGTSNGGTTWVAESVPSDIVNVRGAVCPTAADCIAISQSGPISSADGGATWQLETGTGIVDATLVEIACTTTTCFAAGSDSGGGVVYSSVSVGLGTHHYRNQPGVWAHDRR
jgi:hypothetical protein